MPGVRGWGLARIREIIWIVFPRPMSSARIPPLASGGAMDVEKFVAMLVNREPSLFQSCTMSVDPADGNCGFSWPIIQASP
jgi:hypothetical protein